ncbi:unnamed protein product [Ranitomeya imitator]|uniref:DUF4585 domain-containing protein n=1 Tax=Ranitomeya imitator TaxID=111125 RepID=A0ABN9MKB3_9NEOB|nr:unnamed protein product [Ranitomeya imitator]
MQQAVSGHGRQGAELGAGCADIPVTSEKRAAGSTAGLTVTLRAPGMEDGHSTHTVPEQRPGATCQGTAPSSPSPATVPHQGCANDEAHYITTHEIQLCEADQEPDYPDFGLAPVTWSAPADSAPCSFLEYASFDSQGGTPTDEEDCSYYLSTASDPNPTDSLGSTELVSTYSDSSRSSSSARSRQDEATPGVSTGQILLSIKTASKAINEPGSIQSSHHSAPADARHDPAMSYCLSTAPGSKALPQLRCHPYSQASDAHRLVAVPPRLQARSGVHADISSGASSAVSELDDADKEVRNLTSRAFRSLAYPYFEAINFSSSESTTSLSDQNIGINSWSTYLDWKGGSFLSQKAEKTLHQHTSTTSNFGLKKLGKDASKEQQVYVQANKSETKAFELVVSEVGKGANPASSKCIKSGSRVVTLTETLNFSSSNVKACERANKPASTDHPGSACTDGVTETLPKDRAAPTLEVTKQSNSALVEAMDGTHKSKYASSLLKNIISKKMQLEQEFKMERGELSDTSHKAAPKEGLQRQNSKFSEAGSDFTLVSSEDLGEFFSSTPKDATSLDKRVSPFETHREETICEMKKTASETMKGIFLRSQNSAFRSWKEKEIEKMEKKIEENVAKARRIKIPLERDWRAELGEISSVQSTKMSRLYVPGIQHTPKEKQVEKQATKYSVSTYAHQTCFSRNENEIKSEKLHIMEASVSRLTPRVTPKPQEIKLKLGLSAENKDSPFNIAKLLTPNLAASAASLSKAAEDLRNQVPCRAEVLEKMPQFLVRDVREAKSKVPGAIHQVRDVRKLLKSSYSQDTGEGSGRASVMSDHSATDPKTKLLPKISSSLSPIVISCQAVKNKEESEKGSPQDKELEMGLSETVLVHRASGRLPVATIAPSKAAPTVPVVKIVSKASKWKQEKPKEPEVKPEPQSPQSQVALQKLTAAVKTMEQLYVFDKKEWKRKEEPQQLKGSHVLSMIAGHGAPEEAKPAVEIPRKASVPMVSTAPEPPGRRNSHPGVERSPSKAPENKAPPRTFQVSKFTEAKKQEQPETKPISRASVFTVSAAPARSKQQRTEASLNTKNTRPQQQSMEASLNTKSSQPQQQTMEASLNTKNTRPQQQTMEASLNTKNTRPQQQSMEASLKTKSSQPQQQTMEASLNTKNTRPQQQSMEASLKTKSSQPQQQTMEASLNTKNTRPQQQSMEASLNTKSSQPQQQTMEASLNTKSTRPQQQSMEASLNTMNTRPQQQSLEASLNTMNTRPQQQTMEASLNTKNTRTQQQSLEASLNTMNTRPQQQSLEASLNTMNTRPQQQTMEASLNTKNTRPQQQSMEDSHNTKNTRTQQQSLEASLNTKKTRTQQQSMEASLNTKNTRPQPPSTLKIPCMAIEEPKKIEVQPPSLVRKASADFENYLTIPVKAATEAKPPASIRDPPTNTRDLGTAARENIGTATREPGTATRENIGTATRDPGTPTRENIGTATRDPGTATRENTGTATQDPGTTARENIGIATRDPGTAARDNTGTASRENTGNAKEVAGNPYSSASTREANSVIRESAPFCTLPPFSTKTQDSSPKSPIKAPRDWNSKVREGVQPTRAASAGSEPQTPDSVPPAAIYHHPLPPMAMAMPSAQGPFYYSPPLTSATPAEMYSQTQRKMLVDLATGQYYLVDTPVQPIKRRLFDPETGQYVDVPVPPPPVTPVPLPMPQLALSPGAYGPAYMFYPGFLPTAPTAVLPPNHLQTQLSTPVSEHSYEMPVVDGSHPVDMGMADSPYYLATGSATANPSIAQATSIRRGSLGCPDGKQVISMLSQPGPRIVAPPSFDGTTMRFVVEHR